MAFYNNVIAGAAGAGGADAYKIERSLRFNGGDTGFLNFSPSTSGTTSAHSHWTFSAWVKRTKLGVTNQPIFGAMNGSNREGFIAFNANDSLRFSETGPSSSSYHVDLHTSQRFRDTNAWYHIVVVYAYNQYTFDKARIYVNGVEVTQFSTKTIGGGLYDASYINTASAPHYIGKYVNYSNQATYGDMYLANVHFVAGYTAPVSTDDANGSVTGVPNAKYLTEFGEFSSDTGVWIPKEYEGTYPRDGGFHLEFSDNSSNAALGTDSSGEGNTWTVNNLISAQFSPTITASGDPTSSTNSPFSTGDRYSVAFDGNDKLTMPGPGVVSGDFTMECFVKASSYSGIQRFFGANEGVNTGESTMLRAYQGDHEFYHKGGVSDNGTTIPTNQWNHVAITRSGSTISYYMNGSRLGTDTNSDAITITTLVVAHGYGQEYFTGEVSNARFVDGQALYTGSSYTVPTSTLTTTSQGASAGNVRALCCHQNSVTGVEGALSAKSDIDSLLDSPTNYDDGTNIGGTYATLNPLTNFAGGLTPTNGNLDIDTSNLSETWRGAVATIGLTSGKWYAEFTIVDKYTTNHINVGINPLNKQSTPLQSSSASGHYYNSEGQFWNASSYSSGSYASYDDGDVIGIAVNFDTNRIYYYKNGTEVDYTNLNSNITTHGFQYAVAPYSQNVNKISCNFGQRPFLYPVSGYKAVCTQNLDDPLITRGSDHFIAKTYNGSSGDKVVTTGFSPDLVWIKNMGQARWHRLADSVRGVARNIYTNAQNGEDNSNNYNHKSFDATGFTVWDTDRDTNSSDGDAYISWSWKGGSTFSNSAGSNGASIASSGTANTTSGFSITTYQGNGSSGTVLHGLSSAPDMIWVKDRDASTNWYVYHKDLGGSSALQINSVGGSFSPNPAGISAVSSSTFTLGGNRGETNTSGDDYIAYSFSNVDSYCSVGKYTGNANSDGAFVYTGFRPAFVMVKGDNNYDGGGTIVNGYNWYMYDNARSTYNRTREILAANKAFPQESNADMDFLSNGFKLRTQAAPNAAVAQYYIAFAESPLKYARAR